MTISNPDQRYNFDKLNIVGLDYYFSDTQNKHLTFVIMDIGNKHYQDCMDISNNGIELFKIKGYDITIYGADLV